MQTKWIAGCLMAVALTAPAAEPVFAGAECGTAAVAKFPGAGDFDLYDFAFGVEGQYRRWFTDTAGYALSLGVEQWMAEDGYSDSFAARADGSAVAFPLGGSLLLRPYASATDRVTLEAGLRLIPAISDITVDGEPGPADVSLDPSITGVLAANWDHAIGRDLFLTLGASYQADLMRGGADADGYRLGDNDWEAFGVQAGLRWAL